VPETDKQNGEFLTSSSMGAILKRCREFHKISIEEAAEATKIGKNYLRALESDQLMDFQSLAYLKGFLRIYTAYLGLNSDDIIKICEKQYAPGTQKTSKSTPKEGEPVRRSFPWQKLLLPALLLIMLLVTSSLLDRSSKLLFQRTVSKPAAVPITTPPILPRRSTASSATAEIQEKSNTSPLAPLKTETTKTGRQNTQKLPVNSEEAFIVRMKVIQSGSIAVTIDGTALQNYDLTVGDIIEWKAEKNIALELSNAGGVEAELDGKLLKPFGPAGKPAYVIIGPEGVKQ